MVFVMENCVVRTHFLCFVYINYILQLLKSCNFRHTGKQDILAWQLTVQMTCQLHLKCDSIERSHQHERCEQGH